MKKWSASALIIFVALFHAGCSGKPIQADALSRQSERPATPEPYQTVEALRQIKTDRMETDVPPAAIPLLTDLKHQLRDLILQTLNAQDGQHVEANILQATILDRLKRQGIKVERPELVIDSNYADGYTYGNIESIGIQQHAEHPDLITATTTVGVCCGDDSSLYVFRQNGSRWDLILALESNGYTAVNGALGWFQYRLSPPDKQNNFFVVAADVNPWCSSGWQSLRFKVLRCGRTAYEPQVLLSEKKLISLNGEFEDEQPYSLKLEGNSFSFEFLGEKYWDSISGEPLDLDDPKSWDVFKFEVKGDRVIPIPSN